MPSKRMFILSVENGFCGTQNLLLVFEASLNCCYAGLHSKLFLDLFDEFLLCKSGILGL